MTKLYLAFIVSILAFSFESKSQIINNKIDIFGSIGYSTSIIGDAPQAPSNPNQFARFQEFFKISSISAGATYQVAKILSVGIAYNRLNFSDRRRVQFIVEDDRSVTLNSVGPVLEIHTPFQETSIWNRLELSAQLTSLYFFSNGVLIKTTQDFSLFEFRNENNNYIGFSGFLKASYSVGQNCAIFLRSGILDASVESDNFINTNLRALINEFGITLKLNKNKKYYKGI